MPAVTVCAALGPNPAPLAELIWRLHRDGSAVNDLFLVVDARGDEQLSLELRQPRGVLDELRQLLGLDLPDDRVHVAVVAAADGVVLDDDDPDHAGLYNDAIWKSARAAIAAADDEGVVVFGLTAGRRRTMTAMSTMAFQLLARAQDRCVDVRVSDRRAEGGTGFYFPEQARQALHARDGSPFLARDVEVRVVDVELPRLRGLLTDAALGSYTEAMAVGQQRVDAASVPQLVIDLKKGVARVDGRPRMDVGTRVEAAARTARRPQAAREALSR